MKKMKLSKSSCYGLSLFIVALLLAMTPLVATAANTTVNVLVDSFSPADITINSGDTVTWFTVSVSAGIHTVSGSPAATDGPDSQCQESLMPPGTFLQAPGDTFMHTFIIPGLCHYVCEIHQVSTGMIGTVNVLGGGTTTTIATTTTRPPTTTTAVVTTTTAAPTTTTAAVTTTTAAVTTTTAAVTTTTGAVTTTTGAVTTTTRAATTTTAAATTTTAAATTTTAAPTTTTVRVTTTTAAPVTTTTVATTSTTVRATTTTTGGTTTTTVSTLGDVGIKEIKGPKKADDCKTKKYEVKVKNNSNTTQTRNVQLFVNGVPSGGGQLVTLGPNAEANVKFDVTFASAGTATVSASLFPTDSNPSNDTASMTVEVKDKNCKDKNKDKDKDK